MEKCCPHLLQTLRLSSSSLSKIMVEHLGHLVHSPSGMSRFLDLVDPSLGFLAKVASAPAGGGVTAGSTLSKPRLFFVNVVVDMAQEAGWGLSVCRRARSSTDAPSVPALVSSNK